MSFVSAVTDWAATYPYHALASVSFLYVICLTVLRGSRRNSKRLPYPPGPKGYPIIGNLLDAPTDKPWLTYDEWGKTYGKPSDTWHRISLKYSILGDMIYFKVLGQPFLVLNSLKRTNDLFEKRSSNYSDRMNSTMVLDL